MASPYAASRGQLATAAFWERLAAGQMEVQRCADCGHVRFPPTAMCPRCHSVAFDWTAVSGAGTLWSYTTVRVAPSPELAAEVPYRLGVVQLAEGPLVLGRVAGIDDDHDVVIGMDLVVVIDREGDVVRYHFEPG